MKRLFLAASVIALGALGTELSEDLLGEQIGGTLPQDLDIAIELSAGIVGGEPSAHLLVGQLLKLSSLATHQSALREFASPDLLPHNG